MNAHTSEAVYLHAWFKQLVWADRVLLVIIGFINKLYSPHGLPKAKASRLVIMIKDRIPENLLNNSEHQFIYICQKRLSINTDIPYNGKTGIFTKTK